MKYVRDAIAGQGRVMVGGETAGAAAVAFRVSARTYKSPFTYQTDPHLGIKGIGDWIHLSHANKFPSFWESLTPNTCDPR